MQAPEIKAELNNTIKKFATKSKIISGMKSLKEVLPVCSSCISINPIDQNTNAKANTENAAIIGKNINSLSFFKTRTHNLIVLKVFEIRLNKIFS